MKVHFAAAFHAKTQAGIFLEILSSVCSIMIFWFPGVSDNN